MKNMIYNIAGTFILFGFYLLTAWALTSWPMSFDRALAIMILGALAQTRWHQVDRKFESDYAQGKTAEVPK